jgi:glycosyltransferase involved in cell wall biosynthesis
MNTQLKLSSIIIAKDEESNIERCIRSQLDVIDEIIVIVDSSTIDNTYKVASSFENVNCEIREWEGYSASKKYALSKTKNDWIFWIDADEEFTPELVEELSHLKKNISLSFNAYSVARKAYFLGRWIKHSGWYPARVVRFFNKNFAEFNDKDVHERLIVKGEIGELKNDLNHYTDLTIEHYFQKFNKYTSLAAQDLFTSNKNANIIDLTFRPLFLFVKMYIFRSGFLDGIHGFILAILSSAYVFTKYIKLWELNKRERK